jgi:hypothetical protein
MKRPQAREQVFLILRRYKRLLGVCLFLGVLLAVFEFSGLRDQFNLIFIRQLILQHRIGGLILFVLVFSLGNPASSFAPISSERWQVSRFQLPCTVPFLTLWRLHFTSSSAAQAQWASAAFWSTFAATAQRTLEATLRALPHRRWQCVSLACANWCGFRIRPVLLLRQPHREMEQTE